MDMEIRNVKGRITKHWFTQTSKSDDGFNITKQLKDQNQ